MWNAAEVVELGRHAILRGWCLTGRGGSNPPFGIFVDQHNTDIDGTNVPQNPTFAGSPSPPIEQKPNTSKRLNDTFLRQQCVICVSDVPDDARS